MKTEQELVNRFRQINLLLKESPHVPHWNYKRRMLLKEYNVLHWVLFE